MDFVKKFHKNPAFENEFLRDLVRPVLKEIKKQGMVVEVNTGGLNTCTPSEMHPAENINDVLVAQTGGHNHQIDPDREQHLGIIKMVLENGEVVQKYGEVVTLDGSEEVLEAVTGFGQIDIQINQIDEIVTYVTNRSSHNEKDFLVKLVVDGDEIGREHMEIGLWGQLSRPEIS